MYSSDNFHPTLGTYPQHIALIPDGGRRWAKIHGCTNKEAYSLSMKSITQIIEFAFSHGVLYFSVFFSSTSNFKRTPQEICDFCSVEWDYLRHTFLPFAITNKIKVRIIGSNNANMDPFLDAIKQIEKKTEAGTQTVFFCFNYNSLDEIDAAIKHASKTGISFVNYLQIPHPVDILIRTGNANVLSCFLLPQIASARIFFLEKLFNDFSIDDLKQIIDSYLGYELKYGE